MARPARYVAFRPSVFFLRVLCFEIVVITALFASQFRMALPADDTDWPLSILYFGNLAASGCLALFAGFAHEESESARKFLISIGALFLLVPLIQGAVPDSLSGCNDLVSLLAWFISFFLIGAILIRMRASALVQALFVCGLILQGLVLAGDITFDDFFYPDVRIDYMDWTYVAGTALSGLCFLLGFQQVAAASIFGHAEVHHTSAGNALGVPRTATVDPTAWSPRAVPAVEVGALARELFWRRRMFKNAKYPTPYRLLHRPVLRELVTLTMVAMFGSTIAAKVARASGKPAWRQYRELLQLGIGPGIDAFTYYLLELYRPGGRGEAKYYLTRYETKNGLFSALNAMRGKPEGRPHLMTDKLAFADSCQQLGVPTPPVLMTVEQGKVGLRGDRAELDQDLFVKLRRGRGTKRTILLRRVGPHRYCGRDGAVLSLEEAVENLRRQSLLRFGKSRSPLIVQPCLANHRELADLADESLVTFRIVTCRNEVDEPEATHGILRILSKIEPKWDTAPDSEFGAAVDLESGKLGWLTGDRPETCLQWYARHPVTGAQILGRAVPCWPELLELALRAHAGFPNRILVGWDLALTPEGPVVLEGNDSMDVSFVQRAYRDPIGRSRLGELLQYHFSLFRQQS